MSNEAQIIMASPMVRALLDGRKRQMRQVIKSQRSDPATIHEPAQPAAVVVPTEPALVLAPAQPPEPNLADTLHPLPYAVGDRLWVRERIVANGGNVQYEADQKTTQYRWPAEWKRAFAPPIQMPRRFSRLTLLVESVAVARLHDCGPDDARAEGLEWVFPTWGIGGIPETWRANPLTAFASYWDHAHGPGAWAANPWVVVIGFEALTKNIDGLGQQLAA